MRFSERPEFLAIAKEKDFKKKNDRASNVGKRLEGGDLDDLLAATRFGPDHMRDAAVRLLLVYFQRHPEPLSSQQLDRFVDAMLENIKASYPSTALGEVSLRALIERAPDRAEEFLLDTLDLDRLNDRELDEVARTLSSFVAGWPRAVDKLKQIELRGGQAGETAARVLELNYGLRPDRLDALVRDWQTKRTPEALSRLYHRYITSLPLGETPIDDLLDLLGPPSHELERAYWYHASEGTSLYVEADKSGRLRICRLS